MKAFPAIIMLLFIWACMPEPKPHQIIQQTDYLEVHFGRKMPKSLLDSISLLAREKGILLSYTELKYDGELLSELEFVIQDGQQRGRAKTNFVYRGKPFGFRVDHRPGATSTLEVGELANKP